MKRLIYLALSLCILFSFIPFSPALAEPAPEGPVRLKVTVVYVASLDEYCLRGESGKKYHPAKRLPRTFQHNGLEVMIEARLRPDIVGNNIYGTVAEVLSIHKASDYVSPEEQTAIRVLLARLSAFNNHDLEALRKVDGPAANLTPEQFDSWLQGFGDYRLRYVEALPVTDVKTKETKITGICLYSRERVNSFALSGNSSLALMEFTLAKIGNDWKIEATGAYQVDSGLDSDQVVETLLAKAKQKYRTTDLAEWKGK